MAALRIVHYNHTAMVAGAERVLLNVLPWLPAQGLASVVLCPDGPLQREVERIGVERQSCRPLEARFTWNPLRLARYLSSLWASVKSLRRQFQDLRPDLIHANSVRAGIVASVSTFGSQIPIVWHVHDTLPLHPLSPGIRMLAAVSSRTSLVAVSRSTARTFAGKVFRAPLEAKVAVLHNVIAHRGYPSTAEHRAKLRLQVGVDGRFAVGCVGQICARKNQIALVEMFAQALQVSPHMVLVLAGSALFSHDEPYAARLHRRVRELGIGDSVRLLGRRDDVAQLLKAIDLLVLPSTSEPFPMILLEAMAAALPAIAFAVDGVPELIADGKTGWLVAPGNTKQMLKTLIWAERNEDERKRVGLAGQELVEGSSQADYARQLAALVHARCQAKPTEACLTVPAIEAPHSRLEGSLE